MVRGNQIIFDFQSRFLHVGSFSQVKSLIETEQIEVCNGDGPFDGRGKYAKIRKFLEAIKRKENKLFNICQHPDCQCPVLVNGECTNPQELDTLVSLVVTNTITPISTRLVLLVILRKSWTLFSCKNTTWKKKIALCRRHLGPEKNLIARQHHNQSMHYAETIQRMKSCVCNNGTTYL